MLRHSLLATVSLLSFIPAASYAQCPEGGSSIQFYELETEFMEGTGTCRMTWTYCDWDEMNSTFTNIIIVDDNTLTDQGSCETFNPIYTEAYLCRIPCDFEDEVPEPSPEPSPMP